MKVKDIMRKVVVIEHDTKLSEAASIMSSKGLGSLVIIKDNKLTGIITERDILRNVNSLNSKVGSVMSKDVKTVDSESEVSEAANLMAREKIKKLPVLSGGKLTGIVTSTDIIANSNDIGETFLFN